MDPKKCPRSVNCIDAGCSTCPCAAHPDWKQTMKDAALGRNVRAFPDTAAIVAPDKVYEYGWRAFSRRGSKPVEGQTPEEALKAAGLWKE